MANKPEIKQYVVALNNLSSSNKRDTKFQSDPRKTGYLTPSNEETIKEMVASGLTLYTPELKEGQKEEDLGSPHFVMKFSEQVAVYDSKTRERLIMLQTSQLDPNISIEKVHSLAYIKGHNLGKDYFRITDIMVDSLDDIQILERENPFAI